jgi:hypothetical protein
MIQTDKDSRMKTSMTTQRNFASLTNAAECK